MEKYPRTKADLERLKERSEYKLLFNLDGFMAGLMGLSDRLLGFLMKALVAV